MQIEIPIYVEEQRSPGQRAATYTVRPLFFTSPYRMGEHLPRVMSRLASDLRQMMVELGRELRHDALAARLFNPPVHQQTEQLQLDLRRRTLRGRFLFVSFDAFDRRIAFTPSLWHVWFEMPKGRSLPARAREVLTDYYKQVEREHEGIIEPHVGLEGKAWVTTISLTVQFKQKIPEQRDDLFSLFGGREEVSGYSELHRVGRSIDELYPHELDRVVGRDAQVGELEKMLLHKDRRPVLLLGPRQVGKTAIVHEYVYRRRHGLLEKKRVRQRSADRHNVWLISPQRLISGMKYVGQWENRLLAIIKHAKEYDHTLLFTDLVGLYRAGVTSQSDLSAAHVLKPYIERREVRVIAEITPQSLRVLQEIDRGLADMFHVIPVEEPTEAETQRILIHVTRRLESRYRCAYDMDVLPVAMDLQKRYVHDAAFPGKAAAFLERLAVKWKDDAIDRAVTLREFQQSSGLSTAFLDDRAKLSRREVIDALGRDVIGQRHAVEAAADAVCVAKARLNEPGRPLGTFLFLGPTGVGKTQCAKALAKYLFGDEDRLLRFDMNACVDADAVAKLVGTFHSPDGLLTSAVRRQPFAVVLLDEIEKAHPDVFDMLLQVLGEGRLTDALGRTTDFGNTIIIMTSNLGVRQASSAFGFRREDDEQRAAARRQREPQEAPAAVGARGERDVRDEADARDQENKHGDEGDGGDGNSGAKGDNGDGENIDPQEQALYRQAAEDFFRPEFFNRLDRVVPFHRLSRQHTEQIARQQIRRIFDRDGLLRRRCYLRVHDSAMQRITDAGYHPELGARALKRALERELTRPIAARLSTMKPDEPTVVSVYRRAGELAVATQPLSHAPRCDWPPRELRDLPRDALIERARAALRRLSDEAQVLRPAGMVSSAQLTPAYAAYFAIHEQLGRTRGVIDRLSRDVAEPRMRNRMPAHAPPQRRSAPRGKVHRRARRLWWDAPGRVWQELFSTHDIYEFIDALIAERDDEPPQPVENELMQLLCELAWLAAMVRDATKLADDGEVVESPGDEHGRDTAEDGDARRVDNGDEVEARSESETRAGTHTAAALSADRALLLIQPIIDVARPQPFLLTRYRAALSKSWGFELLDVRDPTGDRDANDARNDASHDDRRANAAIDTLIGRAGEALVIEAPGARELADAETGTHLCIDSSGAMTPFRVLHVALAPGEQPVDALRRVTDQRRAWLADLERGRAELGDDPFALRPVLRVYDQRETTIDLRTGLMTRGGPDADQMLTYLFAQLPLPAELLGSDAPIGEASR